MIVGIGVAVSGVNPLLLAIGGLTLVGAGGRNIGAANGTYGPYTVAGGLMTPNTSPVTPGTYNVGGVTITTEANVYDVGTGEINAVVALGSAALDGKTIKVLPGADANGTTAGSITSFGTALALPVGLTIASRDPANKGFIRRLYPKQNGIINLQDLIIRDFWVPGDRPFSAVIDRDTNSTGSANVDDLRIERCEIYSNSYTAADLNPAAVNSVVTGRQYRIATVASGNWSAVGGSATASVGDDFNATSTGSIAALGTVYAWPQTLRLHGASGLGANQTRKLRIWDSYLHDGEYGVAGTYTSLSICRNHFHRFYGDMHQFGVTGQETLFEIKDNFYQASINDPVSPFGVHLDLCQVNLIGMVQANTVPYTVVGNRAAPIGSTEGAQGIFFENFNASRFPVTVDIRHNMLLTSQANGITLETGSATSVIRWNTLAYDVDNPGSAGFVPKIVIAEEVGGALISDNIHSGLAFTVGDEPLTWGRLANNHQFASFNNAGMDDVLTGTNFAGSAFAGLAAFTAAMMPKVGSSVDLASPKIGAGWYYSWGSAPGGSVSGLGEGTASEPAAGYSPMAVEFQSGEKLAQTSSFTADGSKFALISASFYCPATIPAGDQIIALQTAGGTDRVTLAFASSGRLNFSAINAGGSTIAQLLCATGTIVADTWYTVLYAIDTTQGSTAARMRGWIRPAGGSWSDLSTGAGIHVATLDGIIDNCGRYRVNEAPVQSVYYADLYATLTQTLDISSGTQRDKFLPLTTRGTDGSAPTGTSPAVYHSEASGGTVGNWPTNKGTGGGAVLTGTLSAAPSAPT